MWRARRTVPGQIKALIRRDFTNRPLDPRPAGYRIK